jgi:hypothetical protein
VLTLRILKSKEFARFTRKNRIADSELCRAVAELHAGTVDANLGGGVFKQRLRRSGEGKSGGFRTIILLRWRAIAIFVYGFAKSDRANISSAELEVWRTIAKDLLVEEASLQAALRRGRLMEVMCDEEAVS